MKTKINLAKFYWFNRCLLTGESGSENYTCAEHTPRNVPQKIYVSTCAREDIPCQTCDAVSKRTAGDYLEAFVRFIPTFEQCMSVFMRAKRRELEKKYGEFDPGVSLMTRTETKNKRREVLSFAESIFLSLLSDSDEETAEAVMKTLDIIDLFANDANPHEATEGLAHKYLRGELT